MKIMTVFGTRPEIIRLSVIIKQLDLFCENVLVHTNQNYDRNLGDIFFQELEIRQPDINLKVRSTDFAGQISQMVSLVSNEMEKIRPERILILGDTNSGLAAAIVAARLGIPVFHLEAGNRCYDERVPEEINRRIIDHCSNVLMPYTYRSKENLIREGIERDRIFVVGNPIYEVLETYKAKIRASNIFEKLGLTSHNYFLVTMHRAENVDDPSRLKHLVEGLHLIVSQYELPMIISTHPRTVDKMNNFEIDAQDERIKFLKPFGFFDFITLERNAYCVITDSGTVQEECCIFGVPSVTIRDVTERAETIECGSNVLTGSNHDTLLRAVDMALRLPQDWMPPSKYTEKHVSTTVAKIVLGYHCPRRIIVEK